MKLNVDFSQLLQAVEKMGANKMDTPSLGDFWTKKEIDLNAELKQGIEVDLKEIESNQGLLSYKGQQILLFIPDHGTYKSISDVLNDPSKGNKFHVAECDVIKRKRANNTFERYKATNDLSGQFPIYGNGKPSEAIAKLHVCQKCLKFLNYKGADTKEKGWKYTRSLSRAFSLEEFFSTYSSVFKLLPRQTIQEATFGYTKDWKEISYRHREQANFICSECGVDLSSHKNLLHVHHKNHEKSDNRPENLMVLCADCHRKQPYHQHMNLSRNAVTTINRLRKQQTSHTPLSWEKTRQLADTAVSGVLDYCQQTGYALPEVGYELVSLRGTVEAELELAWPGQKFGVYLGDPIHYDGWTLMNHAQALEQFKSWYMENLKGFSTKR